MTVLVLVVDPASGSRIDPAWMAALLGLTPPESRVSALLAEGPSAREIAAVADLRENYVRWLFQQVYNTQTHADDEAGQRPGRLMPAFSLPRGAQGSIRPPPPCWP